jgi:predicted RNA-binding Zn-ribbon protein involved in translation (DUF1610 family)
MAGAEQGQIDNGRAVSSCTEDSDYAASAVRVTDLPLEKTFLVPSVEADDPRCIVPLQSADGLGGEEMICRRCGMGVPFSGGCDEMFCPDCGASIRRSEGHAAMRDSSRIEPDAPDLTSRCGNSNCSACAHGWPHPTFVFIYFFAWAVLVGAVYLGGMDARWLWGAWPVVGLALFPLAFKAARKAGRLITPFLPDDISRCHSSATRQQAGTRWRKPLKRDGECPLFSRNLNA